MKESKCPLLRELTIHKTLTTLPVVKGYKLFKVVKGYKLRFQYQSPMHGKGGALIPCPTSSNICMQLYVATHMCTLKTLLAL